MLSNCLKQIGQKCLLNNLKIAPAAIQQNYSTEFTIDVKPTKTHNLETAPGTSVSVTKDEALKYYRDMFRIRRLETAASTLYKERVIRGFCHLYSGQEAVAVGITAAMRPGDDVITAYRCHGWALQMGISPLGVLAELTGRQSGSARGKGGSMHMYGSNFYGGNGIVGAQVPLGVGIALKHKYNNKKNVCVALYGDGAANQGQIFEVYNMAKLWDIPVIFVCENNGYGMGTSVERASANTDYYKRGDYVPGIWVNGMDVLAVKETTRYAIEHCDSGKGPILIEAYTYRYSGHSMSDPGTSYRSRDEIQEVRQTRDPITSFKELIMTREITTQDELKAIELEVKNEIDEATKKARVDAELSVSELSNDIYCEAENIPTVRNMNPFEDLPHKRIGQAVNL